ncbi:hypothetical protein [Pseudonocardia sp.]|uniref:hypothetical protein n=1 Tax=Pseudonocardia sp. TaxID=60912 RepID=UPI002609CBA2|nr:hypothetical protein [Pseudonocardia sp.]
MRLTTGTTTSHLGGGLVLPVTVEADTAAFQADLAALLRHAADRIEAGEDRVAQTVAGQEFG